MREEEQNKIYLAIGLVGIVIVLVLCTIVFLSMPQPEKKLIHTNLYLYYSPECPHCEAELAFINATEKKYNQSVNLTLFNIDSDQSNIDAVNNLCIKNNITNCGVPFLIISDNTTNMNFVGYGDETGQKIENAMTRTS